MRIIKPGKMKRTEKVFRCNWCECEFEATVEEYKYHSSQYNREIYVCKCPCCGKNAFSDD